MGAQPGAARSEVRGAGRTERASLPAREREADGDARQRLVLAYLRALPSF